MGELKNEWKNTGKGIGNAFKGFGKTVVKSARFVVDKADDKINDENKSRTSEENEPAISNSNVFNDGSWRETGKGLGKAFGNLGKSIGNTITHPFKKNKKHD